MKDLELLLQLGLHCMDMQVSRAIGDYQGEHSAREKAHSLVFGEGLYRSMNGNYEVPKFLHLPGQYPEYYTLYLRALCAPDPVREEFRVWRWARKALSYLKDPMPYRELQALDPKIRKALLMHETRRVNVIEEGNECIDGFTGGHHRDTLDLITYAVNDVPPEELGEAWVYMDDRYLIQFDQVIDSLQYFRPSCFLDNFVLIDSPESDEEAMSQYLDRISFASAENIDQEANRAVIRYWNDRVKYSGGDAPVRRARSAVMEYLLK